MSDFEKNDKEQLDDQQQMRALRDDFERQLKSEASPLIEDYVERVPEPLRGFATIQLIALESDVLSNRGESFDTEDYIRRFPSQTDLIRDAIKVVYWEHPWTLRR